MGFELGTFDHGYLSGQYTVSILNVQICTPSLQAVKYLRLKSNLVGTLDIFLS